MDILTITLPDAQQAYVDDVVSDGHYASPSDYFAELVLADQKAKAQAKLEALLLEGLKGPMTRWTTEDSRNLVRLAETGE
jgi:antitoxin ParD1/3/4